MYRTENTNQRKLEVFGLPFGGRQISDREVVSQIEKTPYLQYFLDNENFTNEQAFDPSLMAYFRKRLDGDAMAELNEILVKVHLDEQ